MLSLFETHILLSQFLVLHRVYRHIQIRESIVQAQLIQDVIGPHLIDPSHACYINTFVQFLFHILPLRLLMLAWFDRDPMITKMPGLSATMSI
jgi:hypothetical protein